MPRVFAGERNYHIFYFLANGAPNLKAQLKMDKSAYLSAEVDNRGTDEGKAFLEVQNAMKSIGFDDMELHWVKGPTRLTSKPLHVCH